MQEKRMFVDGYVCKCGKIWPRESLFWPFFPAPNPCTLCGTYQKDMSREAVLMVKWQTGRFFKTDHVKYERNPTVCDSDVPDVPKPLPIGQESEGRDADY